MFDAAVRGIYLQRANFRVVLDSYGGSLTAEGALKAARSVISKDLMPSWLPNIPPAGIASSVIQTEASNPHLQMRWLRCRPAQGCASGFRMIANFLHDLSHA